MHWLLGPLAGMRVLAHLTLGALSLHPHARHPDVPQVCRGPAGFLTAGHLLCIAALPPSPASTPLLSLHRPEVHLPLPDALSVYDGPLGWALGSALPCEHLCHTHMRVHTCTHAYTHV
jgi:hypothetical protein